MKRYFPVMIFWSLISLLLSCSAGENRHKDEQDSASMKFSTTVFNFGIIPSGSDGSCYFEFTNDSDQPLIVNVVRTSCGCTKPEWPREPIQPGDSSRIGITYNTKIIGNFHKSITVYSNAENSPVKLFIKGEVKSNKSNT